MGRRTEANRLEHKKKADQKKNMDKEAEQLRKQKLKEIMNKFNASEKEPND
ncbi:hypothetical protein [uncultured Flavobacterium sp.]|uniref:hypothetical protein n=1 Tax=uncultured Flavobacterium sp. TaxID=165435 RepID=UPI0025CD0034|nr:hypothetical protein [uncultured Flavobacterium sp.]